MFLFNTTLSLFQIQAPATLVHGDYTLTSAPRRVAILGEPPKTNDVLPYSFLPIQFICFRLSPEPQL